MLSRNYPGKPEVNDIAGVNKEVYRFSYNFITGASVVKSSFLRERNERYQPSQPEKDLKIAKVNDKDLITFRLIGEA